MANLFSLFDGDISTVNSLNSAGVISLPGTSGFILSSNRALATTTSYTVNTPICAIALCLSSVDYIQPGDTITLRLSTTNYIYDASSLSLGSYSNGYVITQPDAMIGWVVFKLPVANSFSVAPPLSVFCSRTGAVKLMGSTGAASMLIYDKYNAICQPADIIYITKSLTTGSVVENRTVYGSITSTKVFIGDGTKSNNDFNLLNNLYIGRGGLFTGTSFMTANNTFLHVLEGATLSANYTTPTIIGRIKASDSAVVNLNNIAGFGTLSGGTYNSITDPAVTYDYLHDITNGNAVITNTTFWSGISTCNIRSNVSNLSVSNSVFNGKYFYFNATKTDTLTTLRNNLNVGSGRTLNNSLFYNNSYTETLVLSSNFTNFIIDQSFFYKRLDILIANFSNSYIRNSTFLSNITSNGILLSANISSPFLENLICYNRKTCLQNYDTCDIQINGLSCLSSYYNSIYGTDMAGNISNIYIKDAIYGGSDVIFKSKNRRLEIDGLTSIRSSHDVISGNLYLDRSFILSSLSAPFEGTTSLLLTSTSARIGATLPNKLRYEDDFTIEMWYAPLDSTIGANQSLLSIWDPLCASAATKGCILSIDINSSGSLVLNKGSQLDGTPTNILTDSQNSLADKKWYHIAITKNIDIYSIYLDGFLTVSGSNITPFFESQNTNSYNLYTGAKPNSRTTFADKLNGYLAGIKISYGVLYKKDYIPNLQTFKTTPGTLYNLNYSSDVFEFTKMPRVFFDLKNNDSTNNIAIGNLKFITNKSLSCNLIDISNSKHEKIEIYNSDLNTSLPPLITDSDVDFIEGSYIFNNCKIDYPIIDETTIKNYQPYTFRESGIAIQNSNGDPDNSYRWTRGGKLSLDKNNTYNGNSTEKLEAISNIYPLKSSIKLIPVSKNSAINGLSIVYKTDNNYTGGGFLVLEKNVLLNIPQYTKLIELQNTNGSWSTVSVSLSDYKKPSWNQSSFLETYIELTGEGNQIYIAKWMIQTI